jgi:hypothetical protein
MTPDLSLRAALICAATSATLALVPGSARARAPAPGSRTGQGPHVRVELIAGRPAPERIDIGGLVNYGYHGTVVLPVVVAVAADVRVPQAFAVRASVRWMACANLCVPGQADLELRFPLTDSERGLVGGWKAAISEGMAGKAVTTATSRQISPAISRSFAAWALGPLPRIPGEGNTTRPRPESAARHRA